MPASNPASTHPFAPGQSLDCIRALQELIDHYDHIEHFMLGQTADKPLLEGVCHSGCLLAKHMHGGQEPDPALHHLFGVTCKQCEVFHETASQAVLLKETGQYATDGELLCAVQSLRATAERLQEHLVDWYLQHPVTA